MIKKAKSRLSSHFNDPNVSKRKSDLKGFKRDLGLAELRAIDDSNLKMFHRLTAVQPSVPTVVKRSVTSFKMQVSQTDLATKNDYSTQ